MKLATLTKRSILITTAFATLMSSAPSFANTANTCDLEKQTLESLKFQLNAVETQLNWSKAHNYTNTIHGIVSLICSAGYMKWILEEADLKAALAVGSVLAGANTLNAYNFYLSKKEIQYYKDLATAVKKNIEKREQEIQSGQCLSDKVEKSEDHKVRDLFKNLVYINQQLRSEIENLESSLGNAGEKISTTVYVSSTILILGSMIALHTTDLSQDTFTRIAMPSLLANVASQATYLPSLKMSSKEARVLLGEVKKAQDKLKAQEDVLREILD